MSSIARKSNVMNGIKIALMVFSLFLIYPVLAMASLLKLMKPGSIRLKLVLKNSEKRVCK